jgi:hypothetical protein
LLIRKNSYKWFPDKTQTAARRITQRSTGRQKQARFLPIGKLLVKGRYRFKSNSFFAFAACELSRYPPNFVRLGHVTKYRLYQKFDCRQIFKRTILKSTDSDY